MTSCTFAVNKKCGCGQMLSFASEINSKHDTVNHTFCRIKQISCAVCGVISKAIRDNVPCDTNCPCRTKIDIITIENAKIREWFITEAKFKWIVTKTKILPKIRTISKIECKNNFSLSFDISNSKFKSYLAADHGMNALSPGRMFFESNNAKSKVLSLFDKVIPEFKYVHIDSSVDDIGIKVGAGNELIITYAKISYEEDEMTYEVQVLGA